MRSTSEFAEFDGAIEPVKAYPPAIGNHWIDSSWTDDNESRHEDHGEFASPVSRAVARALGHGSGNDSFHHWRTYRVVGNGVTRFHERQPSSLFVDRGVAGPRLGGPRDVVPN